MGCSQSQSLNFNPSLFQSEYKIGDVLGSGTFGQVRCCTCISTGENFAVKVMSKVPFECSNKCERVNFVDMFRNEVSLLTLMNHSHVIKCHGFFEDNDFLYAILTRCDGGELFKRIVNKQRIKETEAIPLVKQMLLAINYVHSLSVIHRDIKAENFLFLHPQPNNHLMLIDFGMSIQSNGEMQQKLCGSPHYIAPELINRRYSFPVDLWSFGVVVYLMLYGRYPFHSTDKDGISKAVLKTEPKYYINDIKLSENAIHFIKSLLAKNANTRLTASAALKHPWLKSAESPKNDAYKTKRQHDQTVLDAVNRRILLDKSGLLVHCVTQKRDIQI